jgi:Lar family restriction alleviation protein
MNNTTTSALKPCPFCGSTAEVFSDDCDGKKFVMCNRCCAASDVCNSPDVAINEWNRRAGESNNAQPAAALDIASDVRAVVQLLSEGEWAERCTKTDLGQQLEAEITRLVGAATAAAVPVVPSFDEWRVNAGRNHVPWVLREYMREGYDACRAAMLRTVPAQEGGE